MRNDFPAGRCRFGHAKHESGCAVFFRNSPDDRPASVADIVVEELRKKEINGPIRLPKRDFFTRGQKPKVRLLYGDLRGGLLHTHRTSADEGW